MAGMPRNSTGLLIGIDLLCCIVVFHLSATMSEFIFSVYKDIKIHGAGIFITGYHIIWL
jgi:hypothetical protein